MTDDEMVNDLDSMPFDGLMDPRYERPILVQPRKCRQHEWALEDDMAPDSRVIEYREVCARCGRDRNAAASRRSRNNRARGGSEERTVAALIGGRKVGQLGLPWDVEVPGYARIQCKKLDRWPALGRVIEWLDAMGAGPELRAVTIADTPGPGGTVRRLIVMDAGEYARWHGGKA